MELTPENLAAAICAGAVMLAGYREFVIIRPRLDAQEKRLGKTEEGLDTAKGWQPAFEKLNNRLNSLASHTDLELMKKDISQMEKDMSRGNHLFEEHQHTLSSIQLEMQELKGTVDRLPDVLREILKEPHG